MRRTFTSPVPERDASSRVTAFSSQTSCNTPSLAPLVGPLMSFLDVVGPLGLSRMFQRCGGMWFMVHYRFGRGREPCALTKRLEHVNVAGSLGSAHCEYCPKKHQELCPEVCLAVLFPIMCLGFLRRVSDLLIHVFGYASRRPTVCSVRGLPT